MHRHVFTILLTARIARLGGHDEPNRAAHAGARHLLHRVGEKRMPVAHADEHRERVPRRREAQLQTRGLPLRERGDRRHAAEQLVVVCDFLDPCGRHLRPRSTLARNGRIRPGLAGPPNAIRRTASNGGGTSESVAIILGAS